MNCFYFLLLIFEIYISKLKFYLIHYFFRMIFIFSFSGPFSTSCFLSSFSISDTASRSLASWRRWWTWTWWMWTWGRETSVILSILLCLAALLCLALLDLYINVKQQQWCSKCIHFKLILLIHILPNITKLIMTSWLSEKCEMVGGQFGSIVDCNLSFNNCSHISYLLMAHQNTVWATSIAT